MFLARSLAEDTTPSTASGGNHLAAELFGGTSSSWGRSTHLTGLIDNASDARAQIIQLGIVLAAYEDSTTREDWRTRRHTTGSYLSHLATLGYELSAVQQHAIG